MSRGRGTHHPTDADLERFARHLRRASARQTWLERGLRTLIGTGFWLVGWRIEHHIGPSLSRRDGLAGAGVLVVAAPHRAWVEPFLLFLAWPADAARLAWLADGRTVTRSWWRRRLLPRLGVIPIQGRVAGPRTYASLARDALGAGRALVVFPEVGPPSAPDRTRALSPGFAYLAIGAQAPVVPVVIGGTHRIVRGSPFSIDLLASIDPGPAIDPFTVAGRRRAHRLRAEAEDSMNARLPTCTAQADAAAPTPERWRWLATLFG